VGYDDTVDELAESGNWSLSDEKVIIFFFVESIP